MFIQIRNEEYEIQCCLLSSQWSLEERSIIDNGDILFLSGSLQYTKRNTLTIFIQKFHIVSKCIKEAPDQFFISKEQEAFDNQSRVRNIVFNLQKFIILKSRFLILQIIRNFMYSEEYIEVDTPILHRIAGGAHAKPFTVKYNYYKQEYQLRIAPELHLKRLIICGYTKIFEIAKNFRNEGISSLHNPEFTMMEVYTIDKDLQWCINFTLKIILNTCNKVIEQNIFNVNAQDIYNKIYNKKFKQIKFFDIIYELCEVTYENILNNNKEVINKLEKNTSIKYDDLIYTNIYDYFDDIVSKFYVKKYYNDDIVIITHYPVEISPLAKTFNGIALRFEIYIYGFEISDGFEEVNDYKIQDNKFKKQQEVTKKEYDTLYIQDMMYGMMPTAGVGIGIDRLIALIVLDKMNINIRNIIAFIQ